MTTRRKATHSRPPIAQMDRCILCNNVAAHADLCSMPAIQKRIQQETTEAMRIQFTQLANAAACLVADTSPQSVTMTGTGESSRAWVKVELERSRKSGFDSVTCS